METDSLSGTGIAALKEKICALAGALPGLTAKWPRAWHAVKEELPEAKKNWMTYDEFCDFCAKRGVPEAKDQEALAESLHDLGLMLAYRKEEALRSIGVLNPLWVTNGIYAVLNAPALTKALGRFTSFHPFGMGADRFDVAFSQPAAGALASEAASAHRREPCRGNGVSGAARRSQSASLTLGTRGRGTTLEERAGRIATPGILPMRRWILRGRRPRGAWDGRVGGSLGGGAACHGRCLARVGRVLPWRDRRFM